MTFDPNRHRRRSIRLPGYDYTQPGAYFVTICAYRRERLFGGVEHQQVVLSAAGHIVEQNWLALSDHFAYIELDAFVVMPDHLHGIIIINDYGQPSECAPADGTRARSLNAVIQNLKSVSTRKINQMFQVRFVPVWQRGYYERVLRDDSELNNVRRYIEANPARWKENG